MLTIYNTLTRKKEEFKPINPGHVGMYVCGPTVYGDAHLGHARPAITFDLLFRYLKHQGYKVRYVRNITDVGHLEHDADEGEDKIAKKARLEQLEPMEVAQHYTNRFNEAMPCITDEQYAEVFQKVLRSKQRSIKGETNYEVRQKLARSLIARGFEPSYVFNHLDLENFEE